jgi:hypothetical protein
MSLSIDRNDGHDYFFCRQTSYGGKIAKELTLAKGISWLDITWSRTDQGLNIKYILESLIANGLEALSSVRTTSWVAVPRSRKHYTDKLDIYGRCTKDGIDTVLGALRKIGYVCISEHRKPWQGFDDKIHKGKCTAYRLTDEFLDFIHQSVPQYKSIPLVDSDAGTCIVKIRDTSKTLDKAEIIGRDSDVEKKLKVINRGLAQHVYQDHNQQYFVPAYKAVHYQGIGGRIYDHCQTVPSEYRSQWTFNGEPVVQFDLTACHASLLYIKNKKVLEGDAYSIDGIGRNLVKQIMVVLLSAPSLESAVGSIARHIRPKPYSCFYRQKKIDALQALVADYNQFVLEEEGEGKEGEGGRKEERKEGGNIDTTSLYNYYLSTGNHTEKSTFEVLYKSPVYHRHIHSLIAKVKEKHKDIAHEFCTDYGVVGQAVEGELALEVLAECVKSNMPCVNVFDGFYVPASCSEAFEAILQASLAKLGLQDMRYKVTK